MNEFDIYLESVKQHPESATKMLLQKEEKIQRLEKQLKRERECVDFYANQSNWKRDSIPHFGTHDVFMITNKDIELLEGNYINTCGKKARETQKARES